MYISPAGFAIEKIVCINLRLRTDRLKLVKEELKRAGMLEHTEFLHPELHTEPKIGYSQSYVRALQMCRGYTSLIVEDDVLFTGDGTFDNAFHQLPTGWDMLYLGGNVRTRNPEKVSANLWRAHNTWCTHANLYHASMIDWMLDFFPVPETMLNLTDIFDEWLRVIAQPQKNCYIVKPFLAVQREDWSDLENRATTYGPMWRVVQRNLC